MATTRDAWTATLKTALYLAATFIIAFSLQLLVHELGHLVAGLALGAELERLVLHPFGNSQVVFKEVGDQASRVVIGLMGIVMDFAVAGTLFFALRKRLNPRLLFVPMWLAIACIGEGIGMLGNIAAYNQRPRYIEDVAQLFTLGVPAAPVSVLSVALVLAGMFLMTALTPMAGLRRTDNFLQRIVAYFACMPLYFALSILYLRLFGRSRQDLEMRTMQLALASVLALVMAVAHPLVQDQLKKRARSFPEATPERRDLVVVLLSCLALMAALFIL